MFLYIRLAIWFTTQINENKDTVNKNLTINLHLRAFNIAILDMMCSMQYCKYFYIYTISIYFFRDENAKQFIQDETKET